MTHFEWCRVLSRWQIDYETLAVICRRSPVDRDVRERVHFDIVGFELKDSHDIYTDTERNAMYSLIRECECYFTDHYIGTVKTDLIVLPDKFASIRFIDAEWRTCWDTDIRMSIHAQIEASAYLPMIVTSLDVCTNDDIQTVLNTIQARADRFRRAIDCDSGVSSCDEDDCV